MRSLRTIRRVIWLLCVMTLLAPAAAYAENPYWGYIYNDDGDRPSLNGYLYQGSIDGFGTEIGVFKSPEDLFVAADDTIYVVDSGNNRVIHMDIEGKVFGVYGDKEGKGSLNAPKGVFVTKEGDVYVADTQNRRVALFDGSGRFKKEFGVPGSPLLGKDFVYSPSKLIVDKRGYLFVSSDGSSLGLMQIRPDGTFGGFFGANHVPFSWTRVLVKLIATKEQREQLASARPPEFSNLFQDSEGFIYTTSLGIPKNQVKRLSAVGVDTLNTGKSTRYGDLFMAQQDFEPLSDAMVDVTVNSTGLITALDQTNGELYQYDKLGNLLFIFGGIGEQNGLFKTPSSVAETSDGTILVTDRTRGRIDLFYPTPFADKVHEASQLYVDGKYEDSMKPWQDALRMNSNYDLAYTAIGKALYRQHEYKEAMDYFKITRKRSDYSNALAEYRKVVFREHFGLIATSVIVLFIAFQLLLRYFRKRRKAAKVRLAAAAAIAGKGEGISGNL
ncbi:hypothetical protein KZ483_27735 [Paenibacillus sp. sptzw28]|uniref:hypothetical protein n=1 Tax=Paenibacillus sp. sptzw28 TaxID=715179 RepID=UPI001C6E82DB|nr:hypothetical protein [Paenibacillus sp. sptzw28]QYR21416.1 hypothetical protein KZ483_27735 [Paenibacillus sp. sptzw28]